MSLFHFSIYKLLTSQHDIQLDSVDSNLHFIEKTVPLFEQTKIASVKDLKDDIVVEDFMAENMKCVARKEDYTDYLHKKIPCRFKIDIKKRQYYNDTRNTMTDVKVPPLVNESALVNAEFIFNEIFPDGKLLISNRCPDNDESTDDDICLKDIVPGQMELSLSKFHKVYNTNLSSTEKRAMFKDSSWSKKRKRKLVRNMRGKFVKQNDTYLNMERESSPNKNDYCAEENQVISAADTSEIENIMPEISDILNLSINASVFDNFIQIESGYGMNDQSEKPCKVLESIIESLFTSDKKPNNIFTLFRPFKDYWMYHCNFSRVKPKNFELLEKMLPRSFRWLLNECASVVEISTEDLYEEVCLVEAYYAYASEQSKTYSSNATSKTENCNNQAYVNAILRKW